MRRLGSTKTFMNPFVSSLINLSLHFPCSHAPILVMSMLCPLFAPLPSRPTRDLTSSLCSSCLPSSPLKPLCSRPFALLPRFVPSYLSTWSLAAASACLRVSPDSGRVQVLEEALLALPMAHGERTTESCQKLLAN